MKINERLNNKILILFIISIILIVMFSGVVFSKTNDLEEKNKAYSIKKVFIEGRYEYQLSKNGVHFMTLIDNGKGTIRTHPGADINGWGTSWYTNPFLSNSQPNDAIVDKVVAKKNKIAIQTHGNVSGNPNDYGNYTLKLTVKYDENNKKITGKGNYNIILNDRLDSVNLDLNLYRVSTNYLINVPLLNGKYGDTGDMKKVKVIGNNFNYFWSPKNGDHFPLDFSDNLTINTIGDYYNLDSIKQGLGFYLEPAHKPSININLLSKSPNVNMMFGAIYNKSQSTEFDKDNVGITPLIFRTSNYTSFNFDIKFSSNSPTED